MLDKPRLLTPGPTPIPERVRLAMARDMIHHRKPGFKSIMAEVQPRLRQLFGTEQPVLTMACSGSGVMTAAVHGLFHPGEKVIVVEGGKFGQRWREMAAVRGLKTVSVVVEWGDTVSPAAVEAALREHPDAAGILVQISETSTGALHPVRELARLAAERDVLLVADGISAVSISPCPMDEWGVDCLLTGSQKGLMLPPGLGLMALSERAWRKAAAVAPSCFYFNLLGERANIEKQQTLFTTPVSLIVGLNESLDMFFEAGLDTVYRKQWALTQMARRGVTALGLEPLVKEGYTWGLTSVVLPQGVPATGVLRVAAERFGVIMAAGQDHLKERIIRIGHMGWVDWADLAAGLHALTEGIRACGGYIGARDALEQSLAAYQAALAVPPGTEI